MARRRAVEQSVDLVIPSAFLVDVPLQRRSRQRTDRDEWLRWYGIAPRPFTAFRDLLMTSREAHGLTLADPRLTLAMGEPTVGPSERQR